MEIICYGIITYFVIELGVDDTSTNFISFASTFDISEMLNLYFKGMVFMTSMHMLVQHKTFFNTN